MDNADYDRLLAGCCRHLIEEQYEAAVLAARYLIQVCPDAAVPRYLLGIVLGRLGIKEESHEALAMAVRLCESGDGGRGAELLLPEMRLELAFSLQSQGRIADAAVRLLEAIRLRPNYMEAHRALRSLMRREQADVPLRVTVITATIGRPELRRAMESVQRQTYGHLEHLIIADGPEAAARARSVNEAVSGPVPRHLLELPYATGAGGFNGHRSYAAGAFLAEGDFVAFLDDDNWFDAEHIASLMTPVLRDGAEWSYSLRQVWSADGQDSIPDNGQSLGHWPTANNDELHLVDVNCYLIRRDIAVRMAHLWNTRYPDTITQIGGRPVASPDFMLCMRLLQEHPACSSNGRHTVNYTAGSTGHSTTLEFIREQNALSEQRYGKNLPWLRPSAAQARAAGASSVPEAAPHDDTEMNP